MGALTREQWYLEQLQQKCDALKSTPSGERNSALFRDSAWLFGFVKAEWGAEEITRDQLAAACAAAGLSSGEIRGTLDSAWDASTADNIEPWRGGSSSGRPPPPPPIPGVAPISAQPSRAAPSLRVVGGGMLGTGGLATVSLKGVDQILHCVWYASIQRVQGEARPITWPELSKAVAEPLPADTEPLPLWSFHTIENDSRARIPNGRGGKRSPVVENLHALLLDYDDEPEFCASKVKEWWGAIRYVAHTSRHHLKPKSGAASGPRGRVVLAISRPITPDELELIRPWLLNSGRGAMGEVELKAPQRIYFRPVSTDHYWCAVNEGGALDVDALLEFLNGDGEDDVEPGRPHLATWNMLRVRIVRDLPRPLASNLNARTVFENDPRWRGRIRLCEFRGQVTVDGSPVVDATETNAGIWLDEVYGFTVSDARIHAVWATIAGNNRTHPVRDYLDGLEWDGTARLDSWLIEYLGCSPEDGLSADMGRCWAIGAVARIFRPGCKLDTVLVLVGPQGRGKSTAIRLMASPEWFADSMLDTRNKDAYQALRGVWLYEWAELDSMKRSESTATKAFLSSPSDHYRPSYGRNEIDVPRQVVFVGSTNEASFLTDYTGSRRFWPRAVGEQIDLDGLRAARDQIWAEAVHRFRSDERWWFDDGQESRRAIAAEAYEHDDPWVELISDALMGRNTTTIAEVLDALEVPKGTSGRAAAMRAAQVLVSMGWRKQRIMRAGVRRIEWVR